MKNSIFVCAFICAFILAGCTTKVSKDIGRDGQISQENVVFPDPNKAWVEPISPTNDMINKIKAGATKDEILQLLSHPHFQEGMFRVVEWDYVLKNNGAICQYKIIFDKDGLAQSFFDKPRGCVIGGDNDQDGVKDAFDKCPNTPRGMVVDENGCEKKVDLSRAILFDTASAKIKSVDEKILSNLVAQLKNQPEVSIIIDGHTDSVGSDAMNMALSQKRADATANELIKRGVSVDRISTRAFGESAPVASNDSADGRAKNRRVEVKFKR